MIMCVIGLKLNYMIYFTYRNVLYFDGMFYMLSIHLNNCFFKKNKERK